MKPLANLLFNSMVITLAITFSSCDKQNGSEKINEIPIPPIAGEFSMWTIEKHQAVQPGV